MGNPRLYKGCKSLNPDGRPKGSKSVKQLLRASVMLSARGRHPITELIRLADKAEEQGRYDLSADIWQEIHKYCEPQKKSIEVPPDKPSTPEESKAAAEATLQLIKDLENGNTGEDSGATGSDSSSLGPRTLTLPPQAGAEEDIRRSASEQSADLRSELLPTVGEEFHNGSDGN